MGLRTNENIAKWTNQTNKEIAYNTNRLNWDINQSQLDYSREMFGKQLAYDYEMWNKTNQWNSTASQLSRWEAAGGNPYQFFDKNGVSTASSSSAPSASTPSMIPMQGYTAQGWKNEAPERIMAALQTTMDGVGKFFDVDKTRAETSMAWQDANFKSTEQTMQVMEGLRRMKGIDEDNKSKILNNYFDGMSMGNRIKSIELNNNYVQGQIDLNTLNLRLQSAQLPYIDENAYNQYMTILQERINKQTEGKNLNKVGRLTDAQTRKVYEDTYKVIAERNNLPKLSPEDQVRFGQAIVDQAVANKNSAVYEQGLKGYEYQKETDKGRWGRAIQGYLDILSPLSGAYEKVRPKAGR